MGNYCSWQICDNVAQAGNITLPVVKSDKKILCEGIWGNITEKHITALSGICLFDARWCVKFKTGALRSIGLPLDRARAETRMKNGFEVESVLFPTELSGYHTQLIDYISVTVAQRDPSRLLFHVPTEEYKQYIRALELLMHKEIPGAYEILKSFAEKVKHYFIEKMHSIGYKSYQIIEPMKICATSPEESYQLPYVHPEIFGVQKDELYAIEDLVEIKIALEVEKAYGHQIPVIYCVLDTPHPYAVCDKKSVLSGESIKVVRICD